MSLLYQALFIAALITTPPNTNDSLHRATDSAVNLAHDLIDRAAGHLQSREERLRQRAASTRDALQRSLDSTHQQSLRARESTRSLVLRHPLAAIGLALVAGAAVAIWSRSATLHGTNLRVGSDSPLPPDSQSEANRAGVDATH